MSAMRTTETKASIGRLLPWRALLLALLGIAVVGFAAVAGGGWYYSDQLREGALVPKHDPSEPDLEVLALEEGRVTLRATPETSKDGYWTKDAIFGLEWEDGYGQVGAILEIDDQRVVREFFPLHGDPEVGDLVRLDRFAFPGDPRQAHDIPFEEVTFTSPLGDFAAWFVDGPRDTWVIFVHGRGTDRREALRMLPSVTELGLPFLAITYRNDVGAPSSPDGYYRFGQTEWEDLEAAAEYAVQHGADELVLVGYSMGGAIVVNFLYESPLADRVVGAVLDAPMLDFAATVDLGARQQGAPGFLTEVARRIAGFRFGIDWGELDYLKRADELAAPILLFHGDEDDTVPVETSDALAEARPDIVTYVRVPEAGHVCTWNVDPAAYDTAVGDFLERVTR
jgi:pimeloyl-ACP methyl ester carboxylesterase